MHTSLQIVFYEHILAAVHDRILGRASIAAHALDGSTPGSNRPTTHLSLSCSLSITDLHIPLIRPVDHGKYVDLVLHIQCQTKGLDAQVGTTQAKTNQTSKREHN